VLIRVGTSRSEHDETSEALYITSGYVCGTAEEAAAAFAETNSRYIFSRYGNPTVSMLEEHMRLLEGAEDCRTTASGMATIYAMLVSSL
jgi:O-succinylhomoserine sulfhydrylase